MDDDVMGPVCVAGPAPAHGGPAAAPHADACDSAPPPAAALPLPGPGVDFTEALPPALVLSVCARLDLRSRCALLCACAGLARLLAGREHWAELCFEEGECGHVCSAAALVGLLQRSRGGCEVLRMARSAGARAAEGAQRFSNGVKRDQVLPHTRGLRAYALAALAPRLRVLSLDERASCVGGMTNDLARALAVHCKSLEALEVFFTRYSLPAELFDDHGLIALSEGCARLRRLALHNCDRVSDRSLYAVAANCPGLTSLSLGGYSEHVTDGGLTVLLEACRGLTDVRLSSKLLKLTDASGAALAANCGGLTHVKLTRAMTDDTLRALAVRCGALVEVNAHRCAGVGAGALRDLVAACPRLRRVVLPRSLDLGWAAALPRCSSLALVEEEHKQGLRVVLATLLPLVQAQSPLISGVDSLQEAPVEREVVLLGALAAVAQELDAPSSSSPAVDAALQVAARLIGSYVWQWPSQRVKTQAALARLLVAAAAAGGGGGAAAPGAQPQQEEGGGVLGAAVLDSVVRELLGHALAQLTPEEVRGGGAPGAARRPPRRRAADAAAAAAAAVARPPPQIEAGPVIVTDAGKAAGAALRPWHIHRGLWLALLRPGTTPAAPALLPPALRAALYGGLLDAALAALQPAAAHVLSDASAAAAALAGAAAAASAGGAPGGASQAGGAGDAAARRAAASVRLAAATQELEGGEPAHGGRARKRRALDPAGGSGGDAAAPPPGRGAAAPAGDGGDQDDPVGGGAGSGVRCDAGVLRGLQDLTAFLASLLPELGPEPFAAWAQPLVLAVVSAAALNPGLFGLYQLAASALGLCECGGLLLLEPGRGDGGAGSAVTLQREELTELFRRLLPSAAAACDALDEQGLAAALELLLAPAALALLPAERTLAPLRLALRLGLDRPAVAAVAVSALEAWEAAQPAQLAALLPAVVPLLHPYLHDGAAPPGRGGGEDEELGDLDLPADEDDGEDGEDGGGGGGGAGVEGASAPDTSAAAYTRDRRRRAAAEQRAKEAARKGLAPLQPRIQLWLGRQGGVAASALAAAAASAASHAGGGGGGQVWCDVPLVGLATTFPLEGGGAVSFEVFLDALLPQLVAVAEGGGPRARRVAAFEALHSVALWTIGHMAQGAAQLATAAGQEQHAAAVQFAGMAARLWPVLLRLAASADPVAWQLFGALLDQIVHWLGSSSDADGAAAGVLMDCLLDAACGGGNGGGGGDGGNSGGGNNDAGSDGVAAASGGGRSLVQLASLLCGEYFKCAVTRGHAAAGRAAGTTSRTGRQLLVRLLDRLGRRAACERGGAAEALAACARALPCRLLLAQPIEATLLVEAHLLEVLRRLVAALADAPGDALAGSSAAASARRALAVLLQQWLPPCLDTLAAPASDEGGSDAAATQGLAGYASSPLGGFLAAGLWPLTAAPAPAQRGTAQQLLAILARELLAAAAAAGAPGAASPAPGDAAASSVMAWLSAVHCAGSTSRKQEALRGMLALQEPHPPVAVAGALFGAPPAPGAAAGSRAVCAAWLRGVAGAADWCCWALEQGLLDAKELGSLAQQLSPVPSALDGVAQLLLLLPDIVGQPSGGGGATAAPAPAAAGPALSPLASGDLLLAAGPAELQAAVLAALELAQHLLGSGMLEAARERALVALAAAAARTGAGAVAAAAGAGPGSVGRLCLMCLLAPERLGFSPPEVAARTRLQAAVRTLLRDAATKQPGALAQLQADLLALLRSVVLPVLAPGAALREPALSAVSRVVKGLIAAGELQPDARAWPGGSLLAPGGGALQRQLCQASLALALGLVGLDAGGGFAPGVGGRPGAVRPPPQVEDAAHGALQLALQLGLPPTELLQLVTKPAGQRLCHVFGHRLHAWLIFNADRLLPPLLAALAAPAAAGKGGAGGGDAARAEQPAAASAGVASAALAVEVLLLGALRSLAPSDAAGARRTDLRTGAFLGHVFAGLPSLAPLLDPTAPQGCRGTALNLLVALVELDGARVLSPAANPAFAWTVAAFCKILSSGGGSVQSQVLVTQAVGALGPVLLGLAAQAQQAGAVADALAGLRCTLDDVVSGWGVTTRISKRSPAGVAYRDQLLGLAGAAVALAKSAPAGGTEAGAGASTAVLLLLIDVLLPELQKMGGRLEPGAGGEPPHPFQEALELRLAVVAAAVWRAPAPATQGDARAPPASPAAKRPRLVQAARPDSPAPASPGGGGGPPPGSAQGDPAAIPAAAQALLDDCWRHVFDDAAGHSLGLRLAVLQHLLLPALELAPHPQQRAAWFRNHVAGLLALAQHGAAAAPAAPVAGEHEEAWLLGCRWAAYRLLASMYDQLDRAALEGVVAGLPGKHGAVVKQATADARKLGAAALANEPLARCVRCAAYAAAASLLRCTQSQAQLFAPAFTGAKTQSPAQMWGHLLDVGALSRVSFGTLGAAGAARGPGGSEQQSRRRQRELQALAAAGAQRGGARGGGSQLFTMSADGVMQLTSQALAASLGDASQLVASQAQGLLAASQAAAVAATPQAGADGGPGGPVPSRGASQAATALYHDALALAVQGADASPAALAAVHEQLAAAGLLALSPEEAVGLAMRERQDLPIDDAYDAHPTMLPLVRLIERALALPSDVPGGMPRWMALLAQALGDTAAPRAVRVFLAKAVLHVEPMDVDGAAAGTPAGAGGGEGGGDQAGGQGAEAGADPAGAGPARAGAAGAEARPEDVYVSDTLFAAHGELLFPSLVAALLPPGAAEPGQQQQQQQQPGQRGGAGGGVAPGRFSYVLRDLVLVSVMWPRLFERTSDDGPLAHGACVSAPAGALLRHLAAVGFDASDSSGSAASLRFIDALMQRWGSRVALTGDDVARHLADAGPAAQVASPGGRGRGRAATGAGAASRLSYGLQLFGLALSRGHAPELMRRGRAAAALWSVLLGHIKDRALTPTRAVRLGHTAGLLLLGLLRVEQRQAAAEAVTAAGGPPVAGVVELQVRSGVVAVELADSMRRMFSTGKHANLVRLLEGAAGAVARPADGAAPAPPAGARSAREQARGAAEALLWSGGGVRGANLVAWLVQALLRPERGLGPALRSVALMLLRQRCAARAGDAHAASRRAAPCAASPAAAAELLEDDALARLAPGTLPCAGSTGMQLAGLQLAGQLLPAMAPLAGARFVLAQLPALLCHGKPEVRGALLALLVAAWRRVDALALRLASGGGDVGALAEQLSAAQQRLEAALLVLACDRAPSLRAAAAGFWHSTGAVDAANALSGPAQPAAEEELAKLAQLCPGTPHTTLLPRAPAQRLAALLRQLAAMRRRLGEAWAEAGLDPGGAEAAARGAEARWPAAAAGLLLALPREAGSAWTGSLFSAPLSSCAFVDYPIQTQAGGTFASGAASLAVLTQLGDGAGAGALGGGDGGGEGGASLSQVLLSTAQLAGRASLSPTLVRLGGGPASQTLSLTQAAAGLARGPAQRGGAVRVVVAGAGAALGGGAAVPAGGAGSLRVLDLSRRPIKASRAQGQDFRKGELRRQQRAEAAARARAAHVKLIRDYRNGELPDVQAVTPKSLWGPLAALAGARPAIAACLLAALHGSMLAAAAEAGRGAALDARARRALRDDLCSVREALAASFAAAPHAPPLVDALQQLAAADRSLWLEPRLLLAAAEASGGLGAAAAQVEEQMLYADPSGQGAVAESAATGGRRPDQGFPLAPVLVTGAEPGAAAGGALRQPDPPACWRALAELYGALAEPDLLGLVRLRHLVKSPGMRHALGLVAAGRHQAALDLLDSVIEESTRLHEAAKQHAAAGGGGAGPPAPQGGAAALLGAGGVPSHCEEELAFTERLTCLQQLGQWEVIQEQVQADVTPDDAEGGAEPAAPDLARLFSSPNKEIRDYLVPYVQSCLLVGPSGHTALLGAGGLLQAAREQGAWLQQLQEVAGVELALCQLLQRPDAVEACRSALSEALRLFCARWSSSGGSSLSALQAAAGVLQPAAELDELTALLRAALRDAAVAMGGAAAAGTPGGSVAAAAGALGAAQLTPALPGAWRGAAEALSGVLLPRWRRRWPSTANAAAAPLLLVLGLRRQLLATLQLQGGLDGGLRRRLAASAEGGLAELQLLAAGRLVAAGCLDAAKALLATSAADLGRLRVAALVPPAQLAALETRGVLAGVRLGLAQLAACPTDPSSLPLLQHYLQALAPLAATARQQAAAPAHALAPGQAAALGARALVAEAGAAAAIARHAPSAGGAAAAASGAEGAAAAAAAVVRQHYATAVQDYHAALALQAAADAEAPPPQGAASAAAGSAGSVQLEFGLLCSHLHQQQHADPGAGAGALPGDAAGVVSAAGGLAALAVRHLLAAMAAGGPHSGAARLHVPTVLAALAARPGGGGGGAAAAAAFAAGWQAVPLHVLLPWASQLLIRLGDGDAGEALRAPLEALAARFPQRLYLPFTMSREHWQRHAAAPDPAAAAAAAAALARAAQLEALLRGPALGELPDLVAALDELTLPKQRLDAWSGAVAAAWAAQDEGELRRLWVEAIHPDVVTRFLQEGAAPARRGRGPHRASTINQAFAEAVGAPLAARLGPRGEHLRLATFRDAWLAFRAEADKPSYQALGHIALERLSGWFGRFAERQGAATRTPLLLPRMLAGPVAVHDFGTSCHIFNSKQRPKLLAVHSSDFRTHKFVVKGGEDARLDERIEQLFVVMARLAAEHAACAARRLGDALVTYDAVPCSPHLGLLGFVEVRRAASAAAEVPPPRDPAPSAGRSTAAAAAAAAPPRQGTTPMVDVIGRALEPGAMERAAELFQQAYRAAWAAPDDRVVAGLRRAEAQLPWDALRHALRRRALHAEAWLRVRSAFAASLAASSAAGYLVGLGDRHLGNLLLAEGSGSVVPIDFGYAFGTAVLALPVPELPPFRLTRQLRGVLQPHDACGLLAPAVVAWVDAAMQSQQVLASILQVFLSEPIAEWQKEGAMLGQLAAAAAQLPAPAPGGGDAGGEARALGVADVKVGQVLRRIAGHNPAGVITAEAAAKHGTARDAAGQAAWAGMAAALAGAPAPGAAAGGGAAGAAAAYVRRGLPLHGLLPGGAEAVAGVLLELATDERILARCWEGWRPWV
ncbi:hypothetical protein HT031_000126 [Scenedesmus sp. PABB004]|nr:hypothetical protein HT031_000126 [Scenedesmus sp. PABB004]